MEVNRLDLLAEKVAKKVIEIAQAGDCDALRLKELTLMAFEEDRIKLGVGAYFGAGSFFRLEDLSLSRSADRQV